jgi:transposase-like protein/IS1 family transposase
MVMVMVKVKVKSFKTLADLCNTFSDNQVTLDHFKSIRWQNGQFCPHCGHDKIYTLKNNRYKCAQCRLPFSILVGTIFENTKLPLRVWFGAIWLLTNHPKGVASTTLARDLGITQKSAWFVLHRLRYAARTKSFNKPLTGIVEVDETYVGGKDKNRHWNKKKGHHDNKTPIMGAVQRTGDVVARVLKSVDGSSVARFVKEAVSNKVSLLATDSWPGYIDLPADYPHASVDHSKHQYVVGAVHTNTIESVWALLKRQILGTHHWVSPKHLQQYVNEMAWRMNRRAMTTEERVNALFSAVEGRLTYKALIA